MFLSIKSLQNDSQLIPIDFKRPWWSIIVKQKGLAIGIMVLSLASNIFWSISPFLIAYIFTLQSMIAWGILALAWFAINAAETYAYQLNTRFQLQIIHSLYQSAHQYLLTIDPRYHVYRSSGTILGKIDRAARGYEEVLDQILFEFMPLVIGVCTMLVSLSYCSLLLMLIVAALCVVIVVGGYYFVRFISVPIEQSFIASDDAFRAVAVENLAQVQVVRATFASDYMSSKLTHKITSNMHAETRLWMAYLIASFILRSLYLGMLFAVLGLFVVQIQNNQLTVVSAGALALGYLRNTYVLWNVLKPFRRYMRGWTAVTDLFDFMPMFGKQGYPVLGRKDTVACDGATISLEAKNISFDYQTASLFNSHTFTLTCDSSQQNKLYGIIGPSGSGKTTLLSILGGQLKPIIGTVCINGIDIYDVTDSTRRQLIALQGQSATTLHGTVKYNLLFGLPDNHGYADGDLLSVLKRVGLLEILEGHKGLETMLGERGLNLSGGQRQRLNFASLYLRARFYKPVVILIDEPTSSLDEVSEQAITQMMVELSHHAITLVIAHRLKTVKGAAGIFDLSLIEHEKDIVPYQAHMLHTRSVYYEQLMRGSIPLDE